MLPVTNIDLSEKCSEEELWREIKFSLHVQYCLSVRVDVFSVIIGDAYVTSYCTCELLNCLHILYHRCL